MLNTLQYEEWSTRVEMAEEQSPAPTAIPTNEQMMNEALKQEDEFLEYLMSLPSRNEPSKSSAVQDQNNSVDDGESSSKIGLDHLDNLCKLMEQLGELREQNFKLQRRVQYLEDLRALQDMHRQLKARTSSQQRNSSEESIHDKNKKCDGEDPTASQSYRSHSVGPDELPVQPIIKAKVSKWTRVKEAFRWEKAHLEPNAPSHAAPQQALPEAKSQDSGIGLEARMLLQVPRTVESVSPADSVLSYSAPMSSSSSSEELMDIDLDFAALSEVTDFTSGPQRSASVTVDGNLERTSLVRRRSLSPGVDEVDPSRRSKSLESASAAGHEDPGKLLLDKKASKTPWGKVKNIIQTRRDSLKRRGPARPGGSDDEFDEVEVTTRRSREPSGDKRPPILTITLPSTEELHPPNKPPHSPQSEARSIRFARRSDPHGTRSKDMYRRQSSLPRPSGSTLGTSPPPHRRPSKWTKVKKAFLTSRRDEDAAATGVTAISMPCSPHTSSNTAFQFERNSALHAEVQRNYEELQSRLSQEFHKKLGEWERRKSNVSKDGEESVEFRKKLHEWEKIKSGGNKEEELQPQPPPPPPMPPPPPVQYHLSPQFRKRLLEWQIRRAVSGKADPHEEHELHKGLPQDFTRKLQEWEKIKAGKTSPRLSRKDSRNESRDSTGNAAHEKSKVTHKEKQLQWLEKELNKVEREKRRLERDREKFLERKARLERMRRAMHSPDSSGEQEVLIQTSTGFFRFHGISEQFTKRLYEWEQQRGIAPEASTFALLDPKFRPEAEEEPGSGSGLVRSKSVGSVADITGTPTNGTAELVQSQPSSLSLNDVEALEAELEESRVSSEPRLRTDSVSRTRAADSRSVVPRSRSNSRSAPRRPAPPPPPVLLEAPGAVIVDVEDEVEESASLVVIPALRAETPVWSVASAEVTSLATASAGCDDNIQPHTAAGVQRGDSVRSASSYQLLEENMQLLAELKHKEATCRQLEAEMEQLERKLQDVAATQNRQIERLRQEETDRTDDEEQQPSEQRVARLRRSVMELGARRERLQRQGQALQDSFAQAWQQQAALAQTLVGRARLLKRGVAEEAGGDQQPQGSSGSQSPVIGAPACWPEDASLAAATPAPEVEIQCQDPVVAKVEDLSTQLLALAEKLEQALSSRTREIQSLRSELMRGPGGGSPVWRERLRPPSGSDSHLSVSLNSLQARETEKITVLSKHFLPRQSSEELAELPSLLTGKVLELKRGLSELCAAAVSREPEVRSQQEKEHQAHETIHTHQPRDEAEESDTPTATFVLRVGGWKRGPNESNVSTPIPARPPQQAASDGSDEVTTSPATSLTLCPPFWRRVPVNEYCSDESDHEYDKSDDESEKCVLRSKTTGSIPNKSLETESKEENTQRNARRCSLRRSKLICEESRDAWRQHQYVTTVSATATTAEAKKLKTRRVSDTHVAYKSQEVATSELPINVFVPTTRKIFSPIKTDESIIGYIISDSTSNIPEKTVEAPVKMPRRRRGSTEGDATKSTDCIVPWTRRTRDSQSASPAMPRKILSLSPESSPRARRVTLSDKHESWSSSPLPPPFPRSPTPNRRAELKNNKETAPSIKLMIAKYNQKLAEKPTSPEVRSPGSYSPAWRSPVAERRDLSGVVRTQMEKYQEEVRKALQEGFSSSRRPVAVQKSASAGIIRSPSVTKIPQREPPPLLKSSSAGAIKSPLLPFKRLDRLPPKVSINDDSTPSSPLDQSIDLTIQTYRRNTASPRPLSSSKSPHQSPCMRALKIKKAREEFLSRGPGALSTEAGCRLSQASAGSGSSFEDLLINNDGLVKSASAGMIHVQAEVYKRLTEDENNQPETSKPTTESKSKFGLLNLASKFRKVRLRKKERLNTVSMLCRQSLLVDLNDSRDQSTSSAMSNYKPSAGGKESVSCPSSPVLAHKTIWIKRNKHAK